jgi:tRNA 2-thiouridine synthesizing protein A
MSDELDLRGLKCPLPALLARRAMARLAPGGRVTVLADDPMARVDIPHMCHEEGHRVEEVAERDGFAAFRLMARAEAARSPAADAE